MHVDLAGRLHALLLERQAAGDGPVAVRRPPGDNDNTNDNDDSNDNDNDDTIIINISVHVI